MAPMLEKEALYQARSWLVGNGRELDRRRFDFHFAGGSADAVLDALEGYQNDDGGYGNALEPDLRTSASSVAATLIALGVLAEVSAGEDAPQVTAAVRFLMASFDAAAGVWPIVPPEVEEAPHAPWWNFARSAETFDGFVVNPGCAVVAHLHRYAGLVSSEFLGSATDVALDAIEGVEPPLSLNDFECVLMLAEALPGDSPGRERATRVLARVAAASVASDPDAWWTYALSPLVAVPAPSAASAPFLDAGVVQTALDDLIERQLDDGTWPVPWSWRDADPVAWQEAEREWKGVLMVDNLRRLRAHGRFDVR